MQRALRSNTTTDNPLAAAAAAWDRPHIPAPIMARSNFAFVISRNRKKTEDCGLVQWEFFS